MEAMVLFLFANNPNITISVQIPLSSTGKEHFIYNILKVMDNWNKPEYFQEKSSDDNSQRGHSLTVWNANAILNQVLRISSWLHITDGYHEF